MIYRKLIPGFMYISKMTMAMGDDGLFEMYS